VAAPAHSQIGPRQGTAHVWPKPAEQAPTTAMPGVACAQSHVPAGMAGFFKRLPRRRLGQAYARRPELWAQAPSAPKAARRQPECRQARRFCLRARDGAAFAEISPFRKKCLSFQMAASSEISRAPLFVVSRPARRRFGRRLHLSFQPAPAVCFRADVESSSTEALNACRRQPQSSPPARSPRDTQVLRHGGTYIYAWCVRYRSSFPRAVFFAAK